jgi:hypothetical protein
VEHAAVRAHRRPGCPLPLAQNGPAPAPAGTAVFITLIVTNRQSWPAIFTDLVPLVLIPLREACHAIRRNGKGTR